VIAIIAILASMLLPSLSSAKDTAKRSACTNNVKQLTTAVHMYAPDNDQKIVKCYMDYSATNPVIRALVRFRWYYNSPSNPGMLWEYLLNKEVMRCPENSCYGVNPWVSQTGGSPGLKITAVRRPDMALLFADCTQWGADPYTGKGGGFCYGRKLHTYSVLATYCAGGCNCGGLIAPRHRGMSVISFVDGHTTSMPPLQAENANHNLWTGWR